MTLRSAATTALLMLALCAGSAGAATLPMSSSTMTSGPTSGSAAALFNEGNAHARAGETGLAVLDYERAKLLAPGDADIRANLRFVRASAGIATDDPSRMVRAATLVSPDAYFALGCCGLLLIGLGVLVGRSKPGLRVAFRISTLAGGALVLAWACNAAALWPTLHQGVVIARSAPARIAPVTADEPAFAIAQAQIVTIEATRGAFVLVKIASGREGWVSRSDVKPIVPREPASTQASSASAG
jgi:hypothetical protein